MHKLAMHELVFAGTDGRRIRILPDLVESVSPTREGVIVRLITGATARVNEPYLRVLEALAGL